jgi:uncharacterized protein (TIGR00369 family)
MKKLTIYTPRDPDYQARVSASFAAQTAMSSMQISLLSLEPGKIVMRLNRSPDFLQQQGFIHGGVITSALDSACGFAALSLSATGTEVLSIEFKTSFMAPARGQEIFIEGVVLKSGRRVSFCEAKAYEANAEAEERRLIAAMTSSLAHVEVPPDWKPGG